VIAHDASVAFHWIESHWPNPTTKFPFPRASSEDRPDSISKAKFLGLPIGSLLFWRRIDLTEWSPPEGGFDKSRRRPLPHRRCFTMPYVDAARSFKTPATKSRPIPTNVTVVTANGRKHHLVS